MFFITALSLPPAIEMTDVFNMLLICGFAYTVYIYIFLVLCFRDGDVAGMVVRHRLHPLH